MTDHEDISGRLAAIEAIVSRLEYRLLGNGQPGELDKIDTRLTGVDTRIDGIDKIVNQGKGVVWIISIILTAISGGLLHVLGVPGFR